LSAKNENENLYRKSAKPLRTLLILKNYKILQINFFQKHNRLMIKIKEGCEETVVLK